MACVGFRCTFLNSAIAFIFFNFFFSPLRFIAALVRTNKTRNQTRTRMMARIASVRHHHHHRHPHRLSSSLLTATANPVAPSRLCWMLRSWSPGLRCRGTPRAKRLAQHPGLQHSPRQVYTAVTIPPRCRWTPFYQPAKRNLNRCGGTYVRSRGACLKDRRTHRGTQLAKQVGCYSATTKLPGPTMV